MVAELTKQKSLYEKDYNLWVLEMVEKLRSQEFSALDLENLIEEIEDLSRRDKQKLESLLMRLIEHLLKLKYWELERQRNLAHWKSEIRNFRKQIKKLLKGSPSLKPYLQIILVECYQDSREIISDKTELPLSIFPEHPIATLEQILDEDWLP